MLTSIWDIFLYQPLFNLLIWIYNNLTDQSLGLSIILLTILLRFVLLPFSLVSEFNKIRNNQLVQEVKRIDKEFGKDEVLKKEEIRKILKKRKVQPWAKAVVLGIQALVLILLYQVFLRGITGEKILQILYPSVQFPGPINTIFFGYDLSEKYSVMWPAVVGLWLFLEIYLDYRKNKLTLKKSDLAYFLLFPLFCFFLLWLLPLVKSLFILTTMSFSLLISEIMKRLVSGTETQNTSIKTQN